MTYLATDDCPIASAISVYQRYLSDLQKHYYQTLAHAPYDRMSFHLVLDFRVSRQLSFVRFVAILCLQISLPRKRLLIPVQLNFEHETSQELQESKQLRWKTILLQLCHSRLSTPSLPS